MPPLALWQRVQLGPSTLALSSRFHRCRPHTRCTSRTWRRTRQIVRMPRRTCVTHGASPLSPTATRSGTRAACPSAMLNFWPLCSSQDGMSATRRWWRCRRAPWAAPHASSQCSPAMRGIGAANSARASALQTRACACPIWVVATVHATDGVPNANCTCSLRSHARRRITAGASITTRPLSFVTSLCASTRGVRAIRALCLPRIASYGLG